MLIRPLARKGETPWWYCISQRYERHLTRWALTGSNRRPLPCKGRSGQFVDLREHADLHMYQGFMTLAGSHRFALLLTLAWGFCGVP